MTLIGKIAKSNSHVDYVCRIFGADEFERAPDPDTYAFGQLVAIETEGRSSGTPASLIGVIYNTILVNPEFGNLGPRLSSGNEAEVFTPDLIDERSTLVGILALGWQEEKGEYRQGVPRCAAEVDAQVRLLDESEVRAFHTDSSGRLSLRYTSLLQSQQNPLVSQLLLTLIERLIELFPEQTRQLRLMHDTIAWKSIVQPAG